MKPSAICIRCGERLMIVSNGAAPAATGAGRTARPQRQTGDAERGKPGEAERCAARFHSRRQPARSARRRHAAALPGGSRSAARQPTTDALLLIHAPSAAAPGTATAQRLIDALHRHTRGKRITLLTNWCERILFSRGAPAVYRGRHSHLPHAGRRGHLPLCIWWNTAATKSS